MSNDIHSIGEKVLVRINKIQVNGCFCSFLPLWQNQFGFMPNKLMPSFFNEKGELTKSVGDNIEVVINNITERGIILSDNFTYEKEQKRLREKEENTRRQARICDFASKYEAGTIFEAEVTRVLHSKVFINLGDIQGVIKKEDTNWNEIDRLEDLLFEGETISAVYINNENGQLYFSLKLLNEKPYDDHLYDLSLLELLKYAGHNSNVFIGQARQYHYGLFIENLYSDESNQIGKLLVDPIYGYNLRAVVPNANFNVEEGKYYKIALRLSPKKSRVERNQLFQFIAVNIEEVDNPYKHDVDLAFQRNTTNPSSNQRDVKLLDEIGKNMYSSKDRMFFELIQNADDAAAKNGVLVYVKTYGDYMIIKHNGYSFDKDDFISITTAANGTKKANENKTGYKGIGFKSVFTDSAQVFIHTGGYKFKFDKNEPIFRNFDEFYLKNNPTIRNEEAKKIFLELYSDYKKQFDGIHSIPWQLEPIWIDSFPTELGEDFSSSNVAIALRLGENKIEGSNGYREAINNIISNPKFMLFLRNTKRIDFNGKSVSKKTENGIITLKNSFDTNRIEYFRREDFESPINNTIFEEKGIDIRIKIDEQDEATGKIIEARFVDIENQDLENIPKKIAINNSTMISFAVPIAEDGSLMPDKKCSDISMFAFLPTLVKDFKFPFYINANFILDPPRQRILGDNPWNFYLMQEIAKCIVRWSKSLNKKQDNNALNILIPRFFKDDSADIKMLAEHFNQSYKSAIETEAFILNHKGELAKQEEIIIDKTGLSTIIGADLFCKLLKTDKCLPSEKIDNKILEENIFEFVEILRFEDVIKNITNNPEFNNWYIAATEGQKEALYKWINENNVQTRTNALRSFVSCLPLFQFGEGNKSREDINSSNYIITTEQIEPIAEILTKLSFVCSDNVFDESSPLYKFIEMQDESELFNSIKECDFLKLTTIERRRLFLTLKDFEGVGEAKLKAIALFRNLDDKLKPLGELVEYRENIPNWLSPYVICKEDYCEEVAGYILKQKDEFDAIIQKHYTDIDASFAEIYSIYKDKWTGRFTQQIIDNCEIDDDILSIVEESDMNAKRYFLERCEKLELLSSSTYKDNTYEYRVLQLAVSVYAEPSDFSSKIYFDGKCIRSFSVSDDVICDFYQNGETKKTKMSLARLLPQYENQSDVIDRVKDLFEHKKDLDKFFKATPKPISEVYNELNKHLNIPDRNFSVWNVKGNALQYLFATYYRRQKQNRNNLYVPKINLAKESDEFTSDLLDFLSTNDLSVKESPFTYHLNEYFANKYFGSDYIYENEQLLPSIEKWAVDDKKKQYLIQNGVRTVDSNAILFRRLFLENKPIEFIGQLSDADLNSGIDFIASATGYERPFTGENQKMVLLSVKDKSKGLSYSRNNDKIVEKAKEWESKEYREWINDHSIRIFIYPGMFPDQLSYKNVVILNYDAIECYYYKQGDRLFVSDSLPIEEVLPKIVRDTSIDFDVDDYRKLCFTITKEEIADKEKRIAALSEENRKKDEIIAQYKKRYGNLTPDEGDDVENARMQEIASTVIKQIHSEAQAEISLKSGKVIDRDGLSREQQIEAHKEAEHVIKEKLENSGYDCSCWVVDDSDAEFKKWQSASQIDNIISPEGKSINLVIKSAKGGYIYLSATDFEFLTSDSNNVLMVWDGKNVHSVTADDIFNRDSNVNLIFDTEYTPKHYYAALSKVFHYIKRTTFAVKNPRYNAFDDIKSFGMDSKTEGVQELFDDNDL